MLPAPAAPQPRARCIVRGQDAMWTRAPVLRVLRLREPGRRPRAAATSPPSARCALLPGPGTGTAAPVPGPLAPRRCSIWPRTGSGVKAGGSSGNARAPADAAAGVSGFILRLCPPASPGVPPPAARGGVSHRTRRSFCRIRFDLTPRGSLLKNTRFQAPGTAERRAELLGTGPAFYPNQQRTEGAESG